MLWGRQSLCPEAQSNLKRSSQIGQCVPGRLFHPIVCGSSEGKGRPAVYILNLVNITNDHISETGISGDFILTHVKKGSKFSAPKTEAGEPVASHTAHIG